MKYRPRKKKGWCVRKLREKCDPRGMFPQPAAWCVAFENTKEGVIE